MREVDEAPIAARLVLAGVACGSVVPLLAWVYDVGSFAVWALAAGLPLVALLVASTVALERTGRWPLTRAAITAGAVGGLVGTLGYDLFRVPFVYGLGLQLLAPIDSYGVLLLDAASSSGTTAFAGWSYHVLNGLGFGVAYAVVMRGRHWGWGVAWAMVLETAVVVSPFATDYALRTDAGFAWLPIVLAYAAHVPYGYAVGRFAQRAEVVQREARTLVRRPVVTLVVLVAVGFALWLRPLVPDARRSAGVSVADGPSAIILDGDWHPAWLRIAPGQCVSLRNDDAASVTSAAPGAAGLTLASGSSAEDCPTTAGGVVRRQVDGVPFSGGWIIVDDALSPRDMRTPDA